jgi:hypothetical protein
VHIKNNEKKHPEQKGATNAHHKEKKRTSVTGILETHGIQTSADSKKK